MSENSKAPFGLPCNVCVTQDVCRNAGECVQRGAWSESKLNPEKKEARLQTLALRYANAYGFLLIWKLAEGMAEIAQEFYESEPPR